MSVKITSKREGFRRCGAAHPKGTVEYEDGRWTAEQLETLRAESMLTVEVFEASKTGTMAVNAEAAIAMIKGAGSLEVLAALVPSEEARKSVLKAVEARKQELGAGD